MGEILIVAPFSHDAYVKQRIAEFLGLDPEKLTDEQKKLVEEIATSGKVRFEDPPLKYTLS